MQHNTTWLGHLPVVWHSIDTNRHVMLSHLTRATAGVTARQLFPTAFVRAFPTFVPSAARGGRRTTLFTIVACYSLWKSSSNNQKVEGNEKILL